MKTAKYSEVLKAYLIAIFIESIIRTTLIYFIFIIIPAVILVKPIIISRTFLEIFTICIIASAFRMYIISPILITLSYFYAFIMSANSLNLGILSYNWTVYTFEISFTLDVTILLVALFAFTTIPMSLSAFYSYFITQASGRIRRPAIPMTGATVKDIISEILSG